MMRRRTHRNQFRVEKWIALIAAALVILPSMSHPSEILAYSTATPPGQYEYPSLWFDDDLPAILAEAGHTATVTDRATISEITLGLLSEYDQLWVLSTDEDSIDHFSASEINAVLQFCAQGHGLLVAGEHTYAPQGQFYASDANQIANQLGGNFHGLADHGSGGTDGPITPQFVDHPIGHQVVEILGCPTEASMSVSSPATAIATYQDDILIASCSYGSGRVVFDASFSRLWDEEIYWANDNPRLVQNYANWLQNDTSSVPTLGCVGVVASIILLGLCGVIGLRRVSTGKRWFAGHGFRCGLVPEVAVVVHGRGGRIVVRPQDTQIAIASSTIRQ